MYQNMCRAIVKLENLTLLVSATALCFVARAFVCWLQPASESSHRLIPVRVRPRRSLPAEIRALPVRGNVVAVNPKVQRWLVTRTTMHKIDEERPDAILLCGDVPLEVTNYNCTLTP